MHGNVLTNTALTFASMVWTLMNTKRFGSPIVLAIIFVSGILGIGSWLIFPSEEDIIREQLEALARAVSADGVLAVPSCEERLKNIGAFFTRQAVVDIGSPFPRANGLEALSLLLQTILVPEDGVNVAILDTRIIIDRRLLLASGTVTASVAAGLDSGGKVVGTHILDIALRQRRNEWLIHDLRVAD